MNINPEMTVLISFIGFGFLFWKKLYPLVTKGLDDHIDEVKKQIEEAEGMKNQASEALRQAYIHKDEVENFVKENQRATDEKMQRLYDDNERILRELREKQEAALEAQLRSEFVKQREQLLDKIADLVVNKLTEKIESGECKIPTNFAKDDLRKLI